MKITHPAPRFTGPVRVGALRLQFVRGTAEVSPLRDRYADALEAAGFTVTRNDGQPRVDDDRPQPDQRRPEPEDRAGAAADPQ